MCAAIYSSASLPYMLLLLAISHILEMVAFSIDKVSRLVVVRSFAFRLRLPRPLLRLEDLGRGHLLGERITMLRP